MPKPYIIAGTGTETRYSAELAMNLEAREANGAQKRVHCLAILTSGRMDKVGIPSRDQTNPLEESFIQNQTGLTVHWPINEEQKTNSSVIHQYA